MTRFRSHVLAVVFVLLVGSVAAVIPAGAVASNAAFAGQVSTPDATQLQSHTSSENRTQGGGNDSVPPGAKFAGVVGVQGAELSGTLESRAFETRLDRAGSNESKAETINQQMNDTEMRLERLRERKQELQAAHENGTISDGAYRARLAVLASQIETVHVLLNRSETATNDLPPGARERVNATSIRTLREHAGDLGGTEVAAAAREIAGKPEDTPGNGPRGEKERGQPNDGTGTETSEANGPPGHSADGSRPNAAKNASDNGTEERGVAAPDGSGRGTDRAASGDDAGERANATAEGERANATAEGGVTPTPTSTPSDSSA